MNDLTTLHLQQFYKKLLAEGRVERIESQKQPKGLSAKTVRNIHQIISSALKLAVEQRLIAHNPADGCALPKAERKEMQTLPVEQLTSFLREAKDSGVFALYYIDLTTGLRRGELLGLKWSDIDLEKGDLRVQRQIGRIDGKIIEMPLKTKNAYRTLPLSADAIDVLVQHARHGLDVHTVLQGQRCEGVAQVMKTHLWQPCPLQDAVQHVQHTVRGHGASGGR